MKILAISGSVRKLSTNTAMLRALARLAPVDLRITVFDGVGSLPVFSPDLEAPVPPPPVQDFIAAIEASDGLIIASPEYVHALPGGLKNAIDWLVSGEAIINKPIAVMHASHRGEDMLASLRLVLSTVSQCFAVEIFVSFPLLAMTPAEVWKTLSQVENKQRIQSFLRRFQSYCVAQKSGG